SFLRRMEQEGYAADAVECFEVPGAFEIPLRAQLLAKSGRYDAIVAAGFVLAGRIYRPRLRAVDDGAPEKRLHGIDGRVLQDQRREHARGKDAVEAARFGQLPAQAVPPA